MPFIMLKEGNVNAVIEGETGLLIPEASFTKLVLSLITVVLEVQHLAGTFFLQQHVFEAPTSTFANLPLQ
jgi:hypothetical protein